jgi:hypothetical protein
MGSFGQTDSREKSPVYATHSPELANGFVWENGALASFRSGNSPPDPQLASFGESPPVRSIGTFRNSTHQNVPMGSFGKTDFREMSPDYSTHSPEFANGFVWSEPLASFGKPPMSESRPVFSTESPETPIGFVWSGPLASFGNASHDVDETRRG